ncbi:hypothetical protein V6L77_15960 [Pannonibacter sp. Pt2-lr]
METIDLCDSSFHDPAHRFLAFRKHAVVNIDQAHSRNSQKAKNESAGLQKKPVAYRE